MNFFYRTMCFSTRACHQKTTKNHIFLIFKTIEFFLRKYEKKCNNIIFSWYFAVVIPYSFFSCILLILYDAHHIKWWQKCWHIFSPPIHMYLYFFVSYEHYNHHALLNFKKFFFRRKSHCFIVRKLLKWHFWLISFIDIFLL